MVQQHAAQDTNTPSGSTLAVLLLYGGVWGLMEATVGFLLHLIPRFAPVPPLAGMVLFPVGVLFMLAAVHASGKPAAAAGVAAVAAAIKASSALLAPIPWLFVQNPVLSILLEGLVVWGLVAAFAFQRRSARSFPLAVTAAVSWRLLFIAAHVVFGIQWGLLARGVPAVLQFVLLDSLVNGVLITALLSADLPRKLHVPSSALLRPVPLGAVLALAVMAEYITSIV